MQVIYCLSLEVDEMTELSGQCLCGSIRYSGDPDIKMIVNCHCTDCQKATGSVHGSMVFVEEDKIEFEGEISEFRHPADSGNTLTKLFCSNCGSQVAGKNTGRAGMIGLRAGTIDQKDLIKPGINLYCSSAVPSTPMDPETKQFEKMPV